MNNEDDDKLNSQVSTEIPNFEKDFNDVMNNELISTIEIEEFKLEAISEEDNVMVELPTQVTDNQISDIIKSETSESEENSAQVSELVAGTIQGRKFGITGFMFFTRFTPFGIFTHNFFSENYVGQFFYHDVIHRKVLAIEILTKKSNRFHVV